MVTTSPFPLTYMRLRFDCRAETPLHLGGLRAGSNLRGALLSVMQRDSCRGAVGDESHAEHCPVCWLTTQNQFGHERRGYVLTQPSKSAELAIGETFSFHVTLFGETATALPYFVLAVSEVGRCGVGPGRGRFALESIAAEYPMGPDWPVLEPGKRMVRPPADQVGHADILNAAEKLAERLKNQGGSLRIEYQTPLRLILHKYLLKTPDFGAFFAHLLMRLDDLAVQHAGFSPRPLEDRQRIWNMANRVRLVENRTRWVEVNSGSSRTGQSTWISGLIGQARYSAPTLVWRELLPWLLWGQVVQVGKDTAKGNGAFKLQFD